MAVCPGPGVPSLDHNWKPWVPSLAEKNSVLPIGVSQVGPAPPKLLMISWEMVVPSVTQSWLPWAPSVAVKNSLLRLGTTIRLPTLPPPPLGLMLLTGTVPPGVPSLFQSWLPWVPSLAAKYTALLNSVKSVGFESPGPGLMSLTRVVPPGVPSLIHNSTP